MYWQLCIGCIDSDDGIDCFDYIGCIDSDCIYRITEKLKKTSSQAQSYASLKLQPSDRLTDGGEV